MRYDFPANTMLAPGAYLIVARDAAAMQAAHPGLTVLGLLDAGELLLDDVTVTELPGTAQARQLIQNGTFQGDTVGASPIACAQRAKPSGYSLWTARRSTP